VRHVGDGGVVAGLVGAPQGALHGLHDLIWHVPLAGSLVLRSGRVEGGAGQEGRRFVRVGKGTRRLEARAEGEAALGVVVLSF
jgi:hypothetical protein